ncbi:MAG: UDP-N-acetylglucosamine 2-epimerase [Candidatus Omnitrophota bacterium]|jgi:UDP-N-acetylglucosamine 2-epimerase
MIHITIGTKAQLIKMTPILFLLKKRGIAYNLIDLGQHSLITGDLRDEFGLDAPRVCLSSGDNISTVAQGISWLMGIFIRSLSSSWIREKVFLNKGGICLIHGDTASTLLGLYLAKRGGLKVAHVEAGLRSFCWSEPFPEELIRIIAMRSSDLLFAPSKWAFENLSAMGLKNKSVLMPGNTGYETTRMSLSKAIDLHLGMKDFCLVTFHRMENIYSRKRMLFIIGLIEQIARELPIVFVQHGSTINQLRKYKLLDRLEKMENRHYFRILSHSHFIHLLDTCRFVITDGGSIQEEAYYLGKPCLLLRKFTERDEGLNRNVVLSRFEEEKIRYFIRHSADFVQPLVTGECGCISGAIVDALEQYV